MTAVLPSAANRFAMRGMAIFPLSPRSKIPLAGSHGCRDASSDPDVAQARWAEDPLANIGIATGAKSALWVIDVDGAPGRASLARLEDVHGPLPLTVCVETPGGGLHLYWKWPADGPEIRNSASRIAPHIDVRGEGGSITAPPSIHPNGGRYTWVRNGARAIVPAPAWFVELARPPPPPPRSEPRPLSGDVSRYCAAAITDELNRLAQAGEGQRNHELNRAAFAIGGFVRAGCVPEDWAAAQLESRATAIGLPAFEARRTIASAFKSAQPRELRR